jgi:hypothetical protein
MVVAGVSAFASWHLSADPIVADGRGPCGQISLLHHASEVAKIPSVQAIVDRCRVEKI